MFKCKFCSVCLQNVNSYVQHCRLHSNVPKARFPCCYRECLKTCSSYAGLRQHISRDHNSTRCAQTSIRFHEIGMALNCAVSSCNVKCSDTTSLVKHLHQHIKDGMAVECPIKHCIKRYSVRSSLSGHLSHDHMQWTMANLKGELQCSSNQVIDTELHQADNELCDGCDENSDMPECSSALDSSPLPLLLRDLFTTNLSLFFVKLITPHLIPESVVDMIAQELQNINAISQQYLQQYLFRTLQDNGVDTDSIVSIMNAIHDCDLIKGCLDEGGILHTNHKRMSYVQRNFHYVHPESVYVGISSRNKTRYCHCVPVKKSLQALLNDDSVLKQCLDTQFVDNNVLSDFTDGSVYKKCTESGGRHPRFLSLILYQDSFKIANPLGSAKQKYKVMGFY